MLSLLESQYSMPDCGRLWDAFAYMKVVPKSIVQKVYDTQYCSKDKDFIELNAFIVTAILRRIVE